MADRAYLAVLANLLYESQPAETIARYQELITKRARIGLTPDEALELRNISPLTLLSEVLGVRRSLLDDKLHGARWDRDAFENERLIDYAVSDADRNGTFETYGVSDVEVRELAARVNEIVDSDRYLGYPFFIDNADLRQEFMLAISEARLNVDFLDSQQTLFDPWQGKEVVQPAYFVFADTTDEQEENIARFVQRYDPFGLNDFLDSYNNDFEAGVWAMPYEENQDTSEVWAWFREFYERG